MQSEEAKALSDKFNFDSKTIDTFILIAGEKLCTKSTAALMVCKDLNSFIKILYPLIILPEFLRDIIYNLIARNRYKLFGKRDVCRIPTEDDKQKFLG